MDKSIRQKWVKLYKDDRKLDFMFYRENKEMNNFISLLDNTLQLNKEDDKSDEEPVPEVKVTADETPRIPKSSSMPSKLTYLT